MDILLFSFIGGLMNNYMFDRLSQQKDEIENILKGYQPMPSKDFIEWRILNENEEVLDNVSTRFGVRTFEIHPENGFILNGKEYPLRGVSRHQDRWGKGNALSKEDHKEEKQCRKGLAAEHSAPSLCVHHSFPK